MKRKIVVFTGAGVSKESGLSTFRDNDGLWEEYKIHEVATPEALKYNTKVFCDFYNKRREQIKMSLPNKAHLLIKQLEEHFDVTVITQNVDDLHEKAGSSNILHLHGTLLKLRSSFNPCYIIDYVDDIKPGSLCPEGGQLRPDIVMFGENLPEYDYIMSEEAIKEAEVIIIIGTSMQVQPAASMPWKSKENCLIYYVDPNDLEINVPKPKRPFFTHIKSIATEGMEEVYNDIIDIFI